MDGGRHRTLDFRLRTLDPRGWLVPGQLQTSDLDFRLRTLDMAGEARRSSGSAGAREAQEAREAGGRGKLGKRGKLEKLGELGAARDARGSAESRGSAGKLGLTPRQLRTSAADKPCVHTHETSSVHYIFDIFPCFCSERAMSNHEPQLTVSCGCQQLSKRTEKTGCGIGP